MTHMFKALIIILLFVLIIPAHAEVNDCEKLAKDYQRSYGGDLVLIQPLKDNGAYDLGEYSGHWMNRAWNKQLGNYYYDPQENTYYSSIDGIKIFYADLWDRDVVVFNYNKGGVPFGIIWHY